MQNPSHESHQDLSLDDLQGASRTVGGHMRGRAHGNVFNLADGQEGAHDYATQMGKVHLYTDIGAHSRGDSSRNFTIPINFSLKPILQSLAKKWPPVESTHLCLAYSKHNLLISYAEENPYISVLEGQEWITKGPYNTALEFDEDVTWARVDGASVLHLCYEHDVGTMGFSGLTMASIRQGKHDSPAIGSEVSSAAGLSGVSGLMSGPSSVGASLSFKDKLVMALEIPPQLANHTDKGLQDAWKKYKAYLDATKKLDELWDAGQLRNLFDRKPVQTDLKNLFKGKTQWHETYHKTFPRLDEYPEMVAWLENQEDKQPAIDLWGVKKSNYTFADLKSWLANSGKGIEYEESSSEEVVIKTRSKTKEKQGDKDHGGKGKSKEHPKGKKKGHGSK